MQLGERMGLEPAELRSVGLGALLHDVGKLRIPDEVLAKPGRLTDDEFAVIRTHAELGAEMVTGSPILADIAPIVRHHHERIDGRGYPAALSGEDIPLAARIVSVCDAWDAMVHHRQYRAGLDHGRAREILHEHAGSQWDVRVVAAFVELLDEGAVADEPTVLAALGCEHDVSLAGHSCADDLPVGALA